MALSLCLLIGAGLFISSLHRITVLDPGFRVENLLFVGFDASGSGYKLDLVQERLLATLSGFFGPLALLLASIGLYGLLAYGVSQRTREIGVRIALGAQRSAVLALVLRSGFKLAGTGVVLGLTAAAALAQLLRSLLFGVEPTDPLTFAAVPVLFLGVALLACWLPARRAAKIDPMEALRYE